MPICPTLSDGKLRQADIGSNNIKLKYDPLGNRVWKQSYDASGPTTTTRKYIVDIVGKLPVILCEINTSTGSLTRSYYYTNDSRIVRTGYQDKTFITYRLGSVRLVVDSSASIKHSYTYTPFGQMLQTDSDAGAVTNNFKFTGQWFDLLY